MSVESVMLFNHLILCQSLLLLPSVFPSIRVFSSKSALHLRWPKYWSFSFSISPSNEYSGLISLRIDQLISLQSKKTFKSLLQHHNLKVSVLAHSASFMVLLSYLYMTTGKTIPLTIWSFVSEVMSLLFNMASKLVIAFFFREQVSFNFMATVTIHSDFGAQEDKICDCFPFSPFYLP